MIYNCVTDKNAVMADHVFCCWCETEMYVNVGEETCPRCGTKGSLTWYSSKPDEQEIMIR